MAKRASFQDAFKSALTTTDTGAKKQSDASPRRAAKTAPVETAKKKAKEREAEAVTKTDVRTVKSSVYFPEPVHDQLIELQNLERKSQNRRVKIHDYIMEGIDLVFKARGLKSISELIGKAEK
jgi:hypothetical protein